jgi:hypothetical protein
MPQGNAAVVDDEYGLEKAPAGSGVTDQEYGLEPVDKNESGTNKTKDIEKRVEKENLTPRMRAAVSSGAAKMQPPTQFEKDHPGEGISLKGTGSAIWDKLKSMVPADPTGGHSPFEKEFWIGEGPKFDPANSGIAQMGREAQNEYQRSRTAGSNPLAAAGSATVAAAASPFGVSNIEQQKMAERGEGGAIIGDTIPAVAAAALPLGLEAVGKIPPIRAMRSGVGNLLVDEMGKPKAIPRLVLGNDRAAALGELAKPEIAERQGAQEIRAAKAEMDQDIASGQQSRAAARQEMFNDLANSRVNRGEEQAKLDTGFEKKLREQETARQKELAANERLKTMQGNDLMRRGTEQEALDKEAGTIPRIVSPTEGEPVRTGSEGRPATWRGERVEALAKKGIRPAITQQIVRGEELPENVRYVMGDPDFPRAVYNPREVTRFTPEGEPIRNKANPLTEGQPSTIPTIARTPRGTIPNIGEATPAPAPAPTAIPETPPLAAQPPTEAAPEAASPAAPETKPLGPVVAKDRTARLKAASKRLEQGLQAKQGAIPNIGEGSSSFKVPANAPVAPQTPPAIQEALQDSGWKFEGRNNLGLYTIREPGTNIKVELWERDLHPDFIKRQMAMKEKAYGVPSKGKAKSKETGSEEVPF